MNAAGDKARLASSNQIRAAMLLWGGGAAGLVETITPATVEDRKTWRVTHYPQGPTQTKINDYDLYDLDQETLAPVRSIRNTEEYRLEVIFGEKEVVVRKITGENTAIEKIPLNSPMEAEGPGLDVFVAGLPLLPTYKTRYIIDRWSGHDSGRIKTVTLSVLKRSTEETSMGKRGIYDILLRAEDDSFQIREKVLAESPHFPVRIEYTREGKTYPASEVVSIISRP